MFISPYLCLKKSFLANFNSSLFIKYCYKIYFIFIKKNDYVKSHKKSLIIEQSEWLFHEIEKNGEFPKKYIRKIQSSRR